MNRLALNEWLAARSYEAIRCLETPQPVLLPNGRRLRGVTLTPQVVLGRDRQLYLVSGDEALPAPPDVVLRRVSLDELQAGYEQAVNAYRARQRERLRPDAQAFF